MWAKRRGRVGEKIAATQSVTMKRPRASTTKATGCCIQLLADRIQKAEDRVPSATMQVATKCRVRPTFWRPNSITPRKLASRKKAVSTSKPSIGPIADEALEENTLQLVPNS